MSDYIKREDAIKAIDAERHQEHLFNTAEDGLLEARCIIATLPSADVVEHKRGEWIDKGWTGDWQFETDGRGNCWHEYECSECGFRNKGNRNNFCPNCGANMRESNQSIIDRISK